MPEDTRTSTRTVTAWSSTTSNPSSCDSTFGVDSTNAAHSSQPSATAASRATAATVTGRRHAGGAAYRSVRVWSTPSMLPPRACPPAHGLRATAEGGRPR